ncbi:MAG: glycerol-3-phosphate 1-O-acyltransferase PlsY [Mycoplasma sp.]
MNNEIAIIILTICGSIFGYLSGSILWSVLIGKIFYKKDLREFESKNAGATNSLRVYGKKVAIVILFLDIAKCMVPTTIMWIVARYALNDYIVITESFNPYTLVYLAGLFSILGHCYPIFFNFKGGKGASCLGALTLCVNPILGLICLLVWFIVMKMSKYVSLASIIGSWFSVILIFVPGINWMYLLNFPIQDLYVINGFGIYWVLFVAGILALASIILTFKHKSNIVRLINGTERKTTDKKNK